MFGKDITQLKKNTVGLMQVADAVKESTKNKDGGKCHFSIV